MRSPDVAGWMIEMEISRARSTVRDLTITGQQTGRVRQAHVPSYEQLGRFTDGYAPFCDNLNISEAQLSIVYRP